MCLRTNQCNFVQFLLFEFCFEYIVSELYHDFNFNLFQLLIFVVISTIALATAQWDWGGFGGPQQGYFGGNVVNVFGPQHQGGYEGFEQQYQEGFGNGFEQMGPQQGLEGQGFEQQQHEFLGGGFGQQQPQEGYFGGPYEQQQQQPPENFEGFVGW